MNINEWINNKIIIIKINKWTNNTSKNKWISKQQ